MHSSTTSIQDIRHVGILVSDIRLSARFYRGLGFTDGDTGTVDNYRSRIYFGVPVSLKYHKLVAPKGDTKIELYYLTDTKQRRAMMKNESLIHISITVNDIWKTWDYILTHGCRVSQTVVDDNGFYLFFGRDLDGNLLEFVQKGE